MKLQISYKNSVIGSLSEGESIALHLNGSKLTEDLVVRAVNIQTITVMTKFVGKPNSQYRPKTITLGAEIKTWLEFIYSSYNNPKLNNNCEFQLSTYAENPREVYLHISHDTDDVGDNGDLFYDEMCTKGILSTDEIISNGVYYATVTHTGGSN